MNLKPAISLIILDFNLFTDRKNWYNKFRYKNVETGEELTRLKELTFVELPKWRDLKQSPKEVDTRGRWNLFLSTRREEDLDMLAKKDEIIRDAIDKLVTISADDKLQYQFDMRLKAEFDYNSDMARAKEDGINLGMEQGIRALIEDNLEEGFALERIIQKLKSKFKLTQEQAENYLDKYGK